MNVVGTGGGAARVGRVGRVTELSMKTGSLMSSGFLLTALSS